jgi:hypothetical protein
VGCRVRSVLANYFDIRNVAKDGPQSMPRRTFFSIKPQVILCQLLPNHASGRPPARPPRLL